MQTGRMPPLSPVYPLVKLWFDDKQYGTRRFYLFSLALSTGPVSTLLDSPPVPIPVLRPDGCRY